MDLASKEESELSDIDEEEETQTVTVAESERKTEGRAERNEAKEERPVDEGTETAIEIDAQHRTVFSVQLPNLDPNEVVFFV